MYHERRYEVKSVQVHSPLSAQGGTRTHMYGVHLILSQARLPIPSPGHMVPVAGLEPARPCGQRILSPLRLPIPSYGHIFILQIYYIIYFYKNQAAFLSLESNQIPFAGNANALPYELLSLSRKWIFAVCDL